MKTIKLNEIADVIMGQSPKGETVNSMSGFPFMQGNRTFGIKYPKIEAFTTDPKK